MTTSKKKLSLVAVPVVSSTLSVSNQDVIAIKIAELEQGLLAKKESLKQQQAVLEEKIQINRKAIKEAEESLAKSAFNSDSLLAGLTVLGATKIKTTYSSDLRVATCGSAFGLNDETMKESLNVELTISFTNGIRHHVSEQRIHFARTIDYPAALVTQQLERRALLKEDNRLQEEIRKVERQLSDMSTYERQVRAQLAKGILNQTEEGRAILADLNAIPGLPKLN